jgi:CMP-N-acetylneuraminic acid synthetase
MAALRVLALIPARSGSQGLRHKNIQKVGDETLLARAVDLARASQRRGEHWTIVVSTDSHRYAAIARAAGAVVPFLRPARLATGRARLTAVVAHALTTLAAAGQDFDVVVMLSPTTPLTRPADVRAAIRLWQRNQTAALSVASVQSPPSWRFAVVRGRLVAPPNRRVGRRQEDSLGYVLNGAIYVASPAWLTSQGQFYGPGARALVMPPERSLDIETKHDLRVARLLLHGCP